MISSIRFWRILQIFNFVLSLSVLFLVMPGTNIILRHLTLDVDRYLDDKIPPEENTWSLRLVTNTFVCLSTCPSHLVSLVSYNPSLNHKIYSLMCEASELFDHVLSLQRYSTVFWILNVKMKLNRYLLLLNISWLCTQFNDFIIEEDNLVSEHWMWCGGHKHLLPESENYQISFNPTMDTMGTSINSPAVRQGTKHIWSIHNNGYLGVWNPQ